MEIIYYGHACFGFKTSSSTVLIDPFISGNELAKDIDVNEIKADYIFLTHAHYDHILDVETIARNNNSQILTNPEISAYYKKLGFNVISMNIGGVKKFDFGKIKMVSASHSSSFPDGTYGGLACGYLMKMDGKVIYVAGDTSLTTDMKLLPFIYGYINVAILPIGNTYTMGGYDAVVAAKFVKTKNAIASHYDTFPDIKVNKDKTKQLFLAEGKRITFLSIGESVDICKFE